MEHKNSRVLLILLLFFGTTILQVTPLTAEDTNCTTADCHKEFKKMKRVHAPADDDCTTCHVKTGKHKFKFEDKASLCITCHDDKKEGKQVHEAVASGECSDCHTHHGGNAKGMLKTKRVDELCFGCHDKEPMEKKFVHGPNASGKCTLCHDAHTSNHKPLLITAKTTICTRCHSDKDFSGEGKHMHSPMKQGCSGCHSPHASDFKYQLHKSPDNLCGKCHQDVVKDAGAAQFKHKALQQDRECFNCHDAHGSQYENNLRLSPLKLCLSCHDKPLIGTDGKDYNINTIVTKNKYKHGPVEDGECSGCHSPHGSSYYKILKGSFPVKFYTPYDIKKYGICFQCHESELAHDKTTTTRTDFRDGDRNLHFVHVNLQKGRTCRACHEIHAGTQEKHIREETPFGSWDIPIGFEKSDVGGSCAPGCHKPFKYKRDKVKGT
ncbi:MAG: cytochrome C [bacterium]|nr:cytochrome C [bacterium]